MPSGRKVEENYNALYAPSDTRREDECTDGNRA